MKNFRTYKNLGKAGKIWKSLKRFRKKGNVWKSWVKIGKVWNWLEKLGEVGKSWKSEKKNKHCVFNISLKIREREGKEKY